MNRLAIIYARFGPYHVARLKGAQEVLSPTGWQVFGIEICPDDDFYAWRKVSGDSEVRRISLLTGRAYGDLSRATIGRAVIDALDSERPDVILCPGWYYAEAIFAAKWCRRNHKIGILMSETHRHDSKRRWWRELFKRHRLRLFDAALVGGRLHKAYLIELGMPHDAITLGHNVVDNAHFAGGAEFARHHDSQMRQDLGLPKRYILASGRFIAKKNFGRLLHAYCLYRKQNEKPLPLVICGDGPLRADLRALADALDLSTFIFWPGFVQYDALPYYYGLANYFIIPSTIEPWGLVVNEAMAAGLPVLVSNRCGCAPELVREGINGYTFEPWDTAEISERMRALNGHSDNLALMAKASAEIIADWGPDKFGQGLREAIQSLIEKRGGMGWQR